MNRFRRLIVSLAIIAVLMGAIVTPAYAWPWSDKANLDITVVPNGVLMVDVINCSSATLSGNGQSYVATVSNPFLSNKCVFRVNNAYVGSGVYYTLRFQYKYTYLPTTQTKTVNVYVKRPVLATYATTLKYTP